MKSRPRCVAVFCRNRESSGLCCCRVTCEGRMGHSQLRRRAEGAGTLRGDLHASLVAIPQQPFDDQTFEGVSCHFAAVQQAPRFFEDHGLEARAAALGAEDPPHDLLQRIGKGPLRRRWGYLMFGELTAGLSITRVFR